VKYILDDPAVYASSQGLGLCNFYHFIFIYFTVIESVLFHHHYNYFEMKYIDLILPASL
jgi:hypothetical protein